MVEMDVNGDAGALDELYSIDTLEKLRVVSDPLRVQIIEALLDGSRTVKQLAAEMQTTSTKLYYHMNLLEEHGFIKVVSTRVVSGIIEKRYGLSAKSYRVDDALLSPGSGTFREALPQALATIFEHTRAELTRSIEAGLIDAAQSDPQHRSAMALRSMSRLSRDSVHQFFTRLNELIDEFSEARSPDEEDKIYALVVALYPTTLQSLPASEREDVENDRGEVNEQ